jgi:hypothetical protein
VPAPAVIVIRAWFNSVPFVVTATDGMGVTDKGLPKAASSVASARAPLLHGRDAHATWAHSTRSGCYPALNQAVIRQARHRTSVYVIATYDTDSEKSARGTDLSFRGAAEGPGHRIEGPSPSQPRSFTPLPSVQSLP